MPQSESYAAGSQSLGSRHLVLPGHGAYHHAGPSPEPLRSGAASRDHFQGNLPRVSCLIGLKKDQSPEPREHVGWGPDKPAMVFLTTVP